MRQSYRHYRIPRYYTQGFRERRPGWESQGGVTLSVLTHACRNHLYVMVGVALCRLDENYCRQEGRKVSRARVGGKQGCGRFMLAREAHLHEKELEEYLRATASSAFHAINGYDDGYLILSGTPRR